MKEYQTKEVRNVVLLGATKSGKTTLAEAMLFLALTLFGLVGTEHRISPFFAAARPSRRTMILNSG